ncbi:hypothetical protein EAG_03945 [Camponotus floridanus]|uniref:Uncharacterized protein n=1 Tax=Camponotus floridanus TaxID=104421 RepID=E2A3P8_CAMFO|nr:hypothetical protein EAG_03945 [Camponotus floridanus]
MLLVNRIEAGVKLSYNWQNSTLDDMPNRTWTIEQEESYQFPFLQIRHLREADLNVTLTCDMKDTLMQYGILLAALTNAFVSLLTLTLQCNLTAACIKERCVDIMKSLENGIQLKSKGVKVTHRERKIPEDGQESALQQDDIGKNESNCLQRIMKSSKFRITSKGDKPVKFFVTSHWLVPFLVVTILNFAEYDDMNTIRHTDTECVFDSNFPMNDFYIFSDVEDNLNIIDSMYKSTTPLRNKYFVNEKLSSKIKPSNAEIDKIILKVQKIVNSALNYEGNSSENTRNTHFLATSESQSMTDYVIENNIINYIKNNINIGNVTGRLNDTLTGQNVSIHDASSNNTNNSIDFNQDLQASFHDLLKNASEESDAATFGNSSDVYNISDDSYGKDAQMYPANTEENQKTSQKTANIAIVQNKTSFSNNQIYNNIIKRIQVAIKNRTTNRYDHTKQSKWSNLKNYVVKREPNSMKNLFFSKNDDFNHYIDTEMKNGTRHMINECLISTKFLQLYLFVLFFVIYFLSILLSCTLQMRGKHVCKSTRAILRAKTDLVSILLRNSNKDNNINIINVLPRVSTDDKRNHSMEESNMSQEARNNHGSRSNIEVIEEDCKSDREIKDENLFLELDCMVRIFNTIKLSFILCIILWTPMLLGILLRVFSCIHAPQWLIDTTFLSAISFGIIRNILNMYIIKIHEICKDAKTRDNKIHPVK